MLRAQMRITSTQSIDKSSNDPIIPSQSGLQHVIVAGLAARKGGLSSMGFYINAPEVKALMYPAPSTGDSESFELSDGGPSATLALAAGGRVDSHRRGVTLAYQAGSLGPVEFWIHGPSSAGFTAPDMAHPAWIVPVAGKNQRATMVWRYKEVQIELPDCLHDGAGDFGKVSMALQIPVLVIASDALESVKDGKLWFYRPMLPKEKMVKPLPGASVVTPLADALFLK